MNDKPQIPEATPAPDSDMVSRLGLDRIAAVRGPRIKLLFAGFGALVLLIAVWFLFLRSDGIGYVTQPVKRGVLSVVVNATGTLAPRDQVDVGAEVSGRLDTVNVDFNDRVRKGQVLAQINTDQIRAQLAQARATLAQARATATQNAQTLKRFRALAARNAISPQDLDNAVANLARAKAGVALAEAQVDADQTILSKTTIRSPIDGVVLDRKVEPGQTVTAALQTPVLFTLASDLSRMELDVDIDEADVGQAHAGETAVFTVDAYPTRRFSARLVSVRNAPKTINGVVTYQGVLTVENQQGLLKPGMTATAEIRVADVKDALLVPNGALRFTPPDNIAAKAPKAPKPENGVNWGRVWLATGGGVQPRDLKLGPSNGHETQVLAGDVAAGNAVATDIKKPDKKGNGSE